jgi:hypothetical protein
MEIHISKIKSVEGLEENRIIHLRRNGDGQMTQMQVHLELFSYVNRINGEPNWLSLFMLYDLNTGLFWWQHSAETDEKSYFQRDIETRLSKLGYWEEEDGVYTHYSDIQKSPPFRFFLADKRVIFSWLKSFFSLDIREDKEQHESFEQAYNSFILKITKSTEKGLLIREEAKKTIQLTQYIDARFFKVPSCCAPHYIVKLNNVKWLNSQWFVDLLGVDWESAKTKKKNAGTVRGWMAQWREGTHQMKVTVVLNEDYEVVDILGKYFVKKKIN